MLTASLQLHAQKKEVVDTDALIEKYQKEIAELKVCFALPVTSFFEANMTIDAPRRARA